MPDLTHPDQTIFDLDPGDAVAFDEVLCVALHLRTALEEEGMTGYPKTSGGRSLHVVIPLIRDPALSFASVRSWVQSVAERLHGVSAHVVLGKGSTHHGTVVSIDAAQNSIGRNTAAPYTLRATSHMPVVSTPLTWDEVAAGGFRPTDFTPQVVLERVRRLGDLDAPILDRPQRLPPHAQ